MWSDVRGRTGAKSGEVFFGRSVGQRQSQGKFFLVGRLDGRTEITWSDGRTVGRSDGGQTEVFTLLYNRPIAPSLCIHSALYTTPH